MNESEEAAYIAGQRAAWLVILRQAVNALGYENRTQEAWIIERQEAVAALRELCATSGDNNWDDELHLADVIDNHLSGYVGKLKEALEAMHINFGENWPDGDSVTVDLAREALGIKKFPP